MKYQLLIVSLFIVSQSFTQIDTKSYQNNLQDQFKEYKESNEESFKAYKAETEAVFNTFKAESEKRFKEYKRYINTTFSEQLAGEWDSYKTEVEQVPTESPEEIPEFVEEQTVSAQHIDPLQSVEPKQVSRGNNQQTFVPDVEIIEDISKTQKMFVFYGTSVTIAYDKDMVKRARVSGEPAFNEVWLKMGATSYYPTVNQLLDTKRELNLNDWGYFQLVRAFSAAVSHDSNQATVLSWFLLNQSRYKAKLAQGETTLGLLIPTNYQIYGRLYTVINEVNYYLFNSHEKSFHTYEQDFSESYLVFDLSVQHPMNLELDIIHKKLSLDLPGGTKIITADFNNNVVDFYKDYPQTELDVYFNSVSTVELYVSVIPLLKQALENYTEIQQLNILQKFLQANFPYQVDDEQFGHEKVCFVEELFFYEYSDCEDRSMLYSWFVRELIGADVVGLAFPGHVACAVHYEENSTGNFIKVNDKNYILCDPSYINSPVGYLIPGYTLNDSELIAVSSTEAKEQKRIIANYLAGNGLLLPDKTSSITYSEEENSYYAFGTINKSTKFGHVAIHSDSVYKTVLVKTSADKKVEWAKVLGDENMNNNALSLIIDNNGDVITTSASYRLKQQNYYTGQYYITSTSNTGRIKWQQNVLTDSLKQDEYDHYTVYVDYNGELQWNAFNKASEQHVNSRIIEDTKGYYFSFPLQSFKQSQVENIEYASSVTADPATFLLNEYKQLKSKNCERSIAGMFALVNVLNTPGNFITGKQLQEAVNKVNPSFSKNNKDIYDGILLIDKICNENNKLIVYTKTGDKIRVGAVQIDNQSRMEVIRYKSGNVKMNVESGIDVVKMMAFSINYATLQQSGKVIFNVKEKDYAYRVRPEIIK